jgi:hypothetical protein
MNPLILTFLIGALCFSIGAPLEPLEVERGLPPTHLEPVDPRPDNYGRLIAEKLHVTNPNYASFTFLPSSSGEIVVSVYSAARDGAESFYITTTRAEENLHASLAESNRKTGPAEVRIRRFDAEIDAEFAAAIQRAWASMLLRTRYPKAAYRGFDGYCARFTAVVRPMGELWGETWSPRAGLTKELVELGLALADYCISDVATRPDQRAKLMKRLESFTRRTRGA